LQDARSAKRVTSRLVSSDTAFGCAWMPTPCPVCAPRSLTNESATRTEDKGGRSLGEKEQARDAAIRSLARDLRIDRDEAEQWFAAWQHYARRQGGARSRYFWDAGRGWIDAQRAMGMVVSTSDRPTARMGRRSRASVVASREVDRAS
jgi:hypothetical protein